MLFYQVNRQLLPAVRYPVNQVAPHQSWHLPFHNIHRSDWAFQDCRASLYLWGTQHWIQFHCVHSATLVLTPTPEETDPVSVRLFF